jgi:diaminohydroxyphosphoribosylaminopyrimidine deaminase/5-amino-6-(5-phosphoribosylamino)uracil reductase
MKAQKEAKLLFMRRALELAKRGGKKTRPNPRVGCVLVKDGKIIAEAWHKKFGAPHAEALALKKAGPKAYGASAYITLEPCVSFPGKKTPSCAEALISAKVKKVVIASQDPNPHISGRGIKLLKKNGILVQTGLLQEECEKINRGFFWRQRHQRPYVILKLALSLDGKAFAAGGNSQWITDKPARRAAHILRSHCDAILVGIETVIKDDPSLTAHGMGSNPLRVILDTDLRIPKTARVLGAQARTLIFTASPKNITGIEVVRVSQSKGRLNIKEVLRELAKRGVETLLVEGGPTVCAAFLKENLAEEAYFFIAPKFLSGTQNPNHSPRLEDPQLEKIGKDFLIHGKIRY